MYFSNFITSISTIMTATILLYISYMIWSHKKVASWGRYIAILASCGLLLCCFAALRDDYHLSVQASIDSSVEEGMFSIDSIQSTICCIGGAVIALASLTSIFIKKQSYRKSMFFVISVAIVLKVIVIEISRIGA